MPLLVAAGDAMEEKEPGHRMVQSWELQICVMISSCRVGGPTAMSQRMLRQQNGLRRELVALVSMAGH
jgi:hypothetical protein